LRSKEDFYRRDAEDAEKDRQQAIGPVSAGAKEARNRYWAAAFARARHFSASVLSANALIKSPPTTERA
jgi:hypothetical protein